MSITDELREWAARELAGWKMARERFDALTAIADHIDSEHERRMADAELAAAPTEAQLSGLGWVKLPVDADGVPIHIGDVVVYDHDGTRTGTPETVRWIAIGETEVHITTEYHSYANSNVLRHLNTQMVEDVLREFGDWYAHTKGGCDEDGIVAEYAEKLREVVEHDRD